MPQRPEDPPGWKERDRQYALVRREYLEAIGRWHEAIGWERHGPEWDEVRAVEKHRQELANAARPPDPKALVRGLDAMDGDAIEDAIAWLERDPFSYRSGYLKQKIMGRLCRVPMSPAQKDRLRRLFLRLTTRGPRQEFRDVCRLARRVDDPQFRSSLRELAESPEPHTAYAAERMLRACETKTKSTE